MGIALKRIGYPLGFAVAGGVNLVALALFFLIMRGKRVLRPSRQGPF
jgi:hypothetical protein